MQPMIVLFGKKGQVGYELSLYLQTIGHVIAFDTEDADFTRPESVTQILRRYSPRIIVNAAAYTAVDKAESDEQNAFLVNAETPRILAEYAAAEQAVLIHYSTDFVFDGKLDRPYRESDAASPLGVYGKTKLQGDQAILASGAAAIIFRTSWVYGMRGKNFLLTMLRLAHEREQMKVVDDQLGSPVWCRHIAMTTQMVLQKLIQQFPDLQNIDAQYLGLFNLTAADHTSWYHFARRILELDPEQSSQVCHDFQPISSSAYPTPAARPQWSVLDNQKIADIYGLSMPGWEEQLKQCMG